MQAVPGKLTNWTAKRRLIRKSPGGLRSALCHGLGNCCRAREMIDEGEITTDEIVTVRLFDRRQIRRSTIRPLALANRNLIPILILLFSAVSLFTSRSGNAAELLPAPERPAFPRPLSDYHDREIPGLINKLVHRLKVEPFNLFGTLIFFFATVHTFPTS